MSLSFYYVSICTNHKIQKMKKNLLFFMLLICSISVLRAQENFTNPIDIGVLTGNYDCGQVPFSDTRYTPSYADDINNPNPDVFYKFQVSSRATVEMDMCDANFDTYIYLYNSSQTRIAANDDSGICGSTASYLSQTVDAGTYYIICEGYSSRSGTYTLDVYISNAAPVPDVDPLPTISGECSATVTGPPPTATDECDGTITGTTTSPLTYNSPGTYTVVWQYSDGVDVTTQNQTVIVTDNTDPVPDLETLPDVLGECSATVSTVPTATDNCSGTLNGTTSDPLTYNTQGTHVVTWNFNDGNGNVVNQNQNVIIDDITDPLAVAKDITVYLDATGSVSIDSSDINNGSSDNCAIAAISLDKENFSCSDVGDNTVAVTVTDIGGNSAEDTATVTVEDNILPTVLANNKLVFLDTNGLATLSAAAVDAGSYDNCGIDTMYLSQDTFYCDDVGGMPPVAVGEKSGQIDVPPAGVPVQLTVVDEHGNSNSDWFYVSVLDTVSPTALCHDTTIYLDEMGVASLTPEMIDGGSFDNCDIALLGIDSSSFDCSDIGANLVTLTVEDVNGNRSSCVASITVADTISPNLECSDIVVESDADACGTIVYYNKIIFSADFTNGQVATSCEDWQAFRASLLADYTYEKLTIMGSFDAEGVSVTDSEKVQQIANALRAGTDVTVNDAERVWRVGSCGSGIELSAAGSICSCPSDEYIVRPCIGNSNWGGAGTATCNGPTQTISVEFEITQSISDEDNCDVESVVYLPEDGSFLPVGETTVIKTITDQSGNSSQCEFTVTVEDRTAPTVLANDTLLFLDADGLVALSAAGADDGSFDNCNIDTMYLSRDTFDCDDVGEMPPAVVEEKSGQIDAPLMGVPVELTVVDEHGNSSSDWFYVSVLDTVSPNALCHDTTIYLDDEGMASLTPVMIDNGSNDNCGIAMLSIDSSSFDCSEIGTNLVTLTVEDVNGNYSSCMATVTVADSLKPIAVVNNPTIYLDANGEATLTASEVDAGSADNCGIDTMYLSRDTFYCDDIGSGVQQEVSLKSAEFFPPTTGSVPVTFTVVDVNGNSSSNISWVNVQDTITPFAICKDTVLFLGEDGVASLDSSDLDNGSSDACGIASYALSKSVFTGVDVGVNLVELTVTDIHGNSAVCTSTVTVQDTIAPELWCQNVGVTLDEQGETRIYAAFVLDSVYDAGGIASYTVDIDKMDCSHVGKNIVTLSVKDYGGNVTTCTAQVTINDLFAPFVACRDFAVALNAEGFAEVPADSIDAGSSDACGIAGMELSQTVFTASDLGENTVTLYVSDVNGNTDSCQAVVRVTDNIAPVVNCNPLEVWVSDENDYELSPADLAELAAGSLDNATEFDSLTIGVSPSVFSCSQAGDSVTVEVMVTDESGNESSCETKVYVSYLLAAELEDIEVTLDSGQCETRVDYPEFFANGCATFTLVDGLGADGLFPVGSTVESWEVVAGTQVDTVTFAVIVEAPNQVPTLDATADTTVAEDQVPELLLTGISAGNDCQAQALTVTASSIADGLLETIAVDYEAGSTTAVLTLSFIANQSGEAEVVVTVEDEMGASITDTFVVTVSPENDAPELVKMIEDQQLQAEDELIVTLSKVLGEVFADADGDELSWTFMLAGDSIPAWMTTEETATEYVLDFTPMRSDTGCYTIVVQVSDPAGATAQDSFELCVTSIPVAVVDFGESVFDVVMYPNPSKGMIRVELETSSGSATEVSVSNVAGAEVFRRSYLSGDAIQLDLSGHVSGMYLVRVAQDGNQVIRKLILDKQ